MRKVTLNGKEYKVFQIVFFGETYDLVCVPAQYRGGELAIELLHLEGNQVVGTFTVLTVNLDCYTGFKDQSDTRAFLDTNNFADAEKFVKKNGIAKPLGIRRRSGYCTYPLYEFDLSAIYA